MEDLIIGGSSVAVVILMVIQLCKSYGLDSKYAPLIAILLGVGASALVGIDTAKPTVVYWVEVTVRGFTYGLGAIGIHASSAALQREADKKQLVNTAQEDQTITKATVTATPEKVTTDVVVKDIGATNGQGTIPTSAPNDRT